MERNNSIDIARFIFAFLVVVIHVPIFGGGKILPLARCAVPFFYLVAGFYLYTNDIERFSKKLIKSIRKWFTLWLTYTLLFAVIAILICVSQGGNFLFDKDSFIELLALGNCKTLDVVDIHGENLGYHQFFGSYMLVFLVSYF